MAIINLVSFLSNFTQSPVWVVGVRRVICLGQITQHIGLFALYDTTVYRNA